jgi:hypothetical protein
MPTLDAPPWTPTVEQVALRILARTRQTNGVLAKTFNSNTDPTDEDVEGVIALTVQLLAPRLGPVPDALIDSATSLAALKAAITVEESFFMEQVSNGASPVRSLMGEYMDALKNWDIEATGGEPNAVKIASLRVGTEYPSYEFFTS